MSVHAKTARNFGDITDDDLSADYVASEAHIKTQNEIAEYLTGMVARRDGKPMNRTRSLAWQRGWGEAQE
jgi:hypothetical protein